MREISERDFLENYAERIKEVFAGEKICVDADMKNFVVMSWDEYMNMKRPLATIKELVREMDANSAPAPAKGFWRCAYVDGKLLSEVPWGDGRWYEWIDKDGYIEKARMKEEWQDYFSPETKVVKERDVIGFREIEDVSE
jgi:hypothetical protein